MEYSKSPLTYDEQADLLLARGLAASREDLLSRLRSVSYYRLSGYWFPFQQKDGSFRPGTSLTEVWARYTFDRRLRTLVMDAIERVEVCLRTELVYHLSHEQGAFGYLHRACLPNLSDAEHRDFLARLTTEHARSRERFIEHFRTAYGDMHVLPPYWMMAELMTFGTLLTLFRGSPTTVKKRIASRFGVTSAVLESWLRTLNVVRNICAHHGRMWNRELTYRPLIPRKDTRWHSPVEVTGDRLFGILTILKYLLDEIAPQSGWTTRLQALRECYPTVPIRSMGYPQGWESCPIWRGTDD